MRITPKVITVLTLMEKSGPKYGDQIAKLKPSEFFGSTRSVGFSDLTSIYVMLRTMEKNGLIRHMKDFHPDVGDGSGQAAQRKWYDLTADGRKVLTEAREVLGVV